MYFSIGRAARFLGVSIATLRRWEKSKLVIPSYKTLGGHRRYDVNLLRKCSGENISTCTEKVSIGYARVSSHDQKEDLKRQVSRLEKHMEKDKNVEVINDLGSGINFKKKGLKKLLKLILNGEVSKIVLTHKDRLLRFGSELLFMICDYYRVEIEILDDKKKMSDEEAIVYDVLEILTVFTAKIYGKRSHKNKTVLA